MFAMFYPFCFLPIMFANVEISSFVLVQFNHVFIILEFELLMITVLKESGVDFLRDDLSSDVILGSQT